MKNLFILSIICVLCWSCDTNFCCGTNGPEHIREFYEDKTMTLNSGEPNNPFTINDGEDFVFQYSFVHPEEEAIADDELTETLTWLVDSNSASFSITTVDIAKAIPVPVVYRRLCFCGFISGFSIESLNITGTKISPTRWQVSLEMTATFEDNTYNLTDEGVYTLSEF